MHTRFTVLGPLRAWRGGIELELGPPKQRALLAFLLAQPNHPVGTHEIVDALWSQNPPDSAVNVVHRHIGALRRLFEPDMPSRGTSRWLVRASGGYRLDADLESLDLLRFRHLRERASGTGDPAEATELLVEALTLWRGPTAAGIPPEVRAHPAFGAVDGEHLAVVKQAAERALETGREPRARVLVTLRQAAALHTLDEALQARLILTLAATGHQAEALEVYRTVRARLADDLGVQPGPELQAAQRRVLAQTYVWDDSAPAGGTRSADHMSLDARTEPAGSGPESGTAEPFDPDRRESHVVPPAQLPAKLSSFTGRFDELARFRGLLPGSSASALVIGVIGGMAGVGKTALAVHWAHQVADRFPDGQLYVDLRGFHPSGTVMSPAEAIRSFLGALGVPAQRVPAGLDAQAALYRSLLARRRVLIVLDNARDTEHVRALLPGAPGCLVVVTTRHQLYGLVAAEGAHFLTLDVLGEDDALRFLSDRLGPDRIERDPGAARAIAAACGGLPLALAVVSARAAINPAFPLSGIAEELAESEGSLHAFSGEAPATDARSAFSWSYRLLSPEAARVFRLLAHHPGADCSVAAAASLAGVRRAEVRPLLAELCRAHLVSETGPGSFTCHELLRAYGSELGRSLDALPERRAARRRMFDHYLHCAHAADSVLAPSRERLILGPPVAGTVVSEFADQARAAEWLEANRSVLLAAVEHSARRGCGEQSWQLAATIELYLDRSGRRQEQLVAQTTAARAAQGLGDVRGQAHAHRALGFANGRLERWVDAAGHLARALDLFAYVGDRAGQGRVHRYAAFLANARGRHGEALEHYARAGVLYREAGRRSGEASVANEVGWTYILTGRYREALEECGRALAVHQEIDDRNGAAAAWDSLGYAHHHLHEHDRALTCYERALELYRAIRDRSLEADTLVHIGDTRYAAGEHERAAGAWRQALDILDGIGHPDAEAVRGKLKDAVAARAGEHPAHP
ncbi:DNA-binding SARP family transcriptional activator/tetratricopeptide (TPR) repeat protein [Streptomyces umbrinus]|uniref:DNA-binding SARP family transcriptional activator/tetratricopeptide (TPR) repeat protein n=1 Tax=Streptomyces umbrinus TaxID=67370 RepID=A0ABU0TB91_9ACTN|nr:BTAD domain-containing putative transcriptional regulator [Streptomyces umbrinus]MDQ1032857.1 DNA-binding SARP family transcriptional activator/tetratricopeptide (TPR) repeat protein [Streptomyces umbrinus]